MAKPTKAEDDAALKLGRQLLERPASIEAEQAILGILMFDAQAIHLLPTGLESDDFSEPVHQRLFATIREVVGAGMTPEPIIVFEEMRIDPGLREMGGLRYLADLIDHAPPTHLVQDYGRVVLKLSMAREVMRVGVEMALLVGAAEEAPEDSVSIADQRISALRIRDRRDDPVHIAAAAGATVEYVKDRDVLPGVKTGLFNIDRSTGPWLPGDLVILAGATGAGKSAIATAVSQNVANPTLAAAMNGMRHEDTRKPKGVIAFHLEMTFGKATRTGEKAESGQAVRRHMADIGWHMFGSDFPTYADIRAKNVNAVQAEMMAEVAQYVTNMPLVGISGSRFTIPRMRSIIMRQKAAWERAGIELGLVLIDHLGLVRVEKPINRYQDQTAVALDAKELAKEVGSPVLALAQISREVAKSTDDKRPRLDHLKDSGELENSCDICLLAYRDSYYAVKEKPPDDAKDPGGWAAWDARCRSQEVEIIMGKVREGAMGKTEKVWTDYPYNVVRNEERADRAKIL